MQLSENTSKELSIRDLIEALYRHRLVVLWCTVGTLLVGLLYAIFATPLYTASVTMVPVNEEKPGGLGNLAGQLGSIASLAGINIPGGGSNAVEYVAILKSRQVGESFIREYNLKRHLFPEKWDEGRGTWKSAEAGSKPSLLARMRRQVSAIMARLSGDQGWKGRPAEAEPSTWLAYALFNEDIRLVQEDPETGLITVLFRFSDPELAAKWANAYVDMVNHEIRNKTIAEASRALSYLKAQAEETSVMGVRDTIFALVKNQLERIALANAREDYAFKIIDRAVVPETRSHPRRGLIVILSAALGCMLGVLVAFGREAWSRHGAS